MPSSATVTAFYTFVSGTKAKSSQVNGNFDIYRGHLIPIDPNTATAIDQAYNLGSTEYQWNNLYVKNPPFINGVSSQYIKTEDLYDGVNPPDQTDIGVAQSVIKFSPGSDQDGYFKLPLPSDYIAGNQIKLRVWCHVDTVTTQIFEVSSYLFKNNTASAVSIESLPAAEVNTATLSFNTASSNKLITGEFFTVNDTGGFINSVTCTAFDYLLVNFKRVGSNAGDSGGAFYLADHIFNLNA